MNKYLTIIMIIINYVLQKYNALNAKLKEIAKYRNFLKNFHIQIK